MQDNREYKLYFSVIKNAIKPLKKLFFRTKKNFYFFYSIILIKLEIRRNNFLKIKDNEEINLIYDLSISPLTYGDLYNFLFLCRYFLIHGYKLNYFLINDAKINSDMKRFDINNLDFFIEDLKNLSSELLDHKNSSLIFCSWEQFIRNYKKNLKNQIILFEKRIFKRKKIYHLCFKMLNFLIKNSSYLLIFFY